MLSVLEPLAPLVDLEYHPEFTQITKIFDLIEHKQTDWCRFRLC